MLSWGGGKPPPQTPLLHKTTDFDGKTNPGGVLQSTQYRCCTMLLNQRVAYSGCRTLP